MSTVVDTASPAARPRRAHRPGARRAASSRAGVVVLQLATIGGLVLLWQLASGPGEDALIDSYYVSEPTAIAAVLAQWSADGQLWSSTLTTVGTTLAGFAVGVVLGLAAGFVVGVNPLLARVVAPIVAALYSIPRLALVPLFILWFGIGIGSKIALVVSVVAFLVFYSTYAGVRDVDAQLLDRLRLMRASRWQVHTKVTLPSAMTFILAGLGISAPYALVAAVTAEMFSSNRGLGYLLIRSSTQYFTDGVFAAIVVMMVLGMALLFVIGRLERRVGRWKPQARR